MVLLLGSSLIAVLIAEVAVRLLDIPPRPLDPLPVPSYQLSDDPIIGYEYRPNYKPSDEPNDWSLENFAINSDGFRDREYTDKKPAGVYRIVVLGSSITAGHGVPDLDDIFPKQLERLLNDTTASKQGDSAAPTYEVLNLGVGGYQPMQSVETLKVKGLKYSPDMVILALGVNDFSLWLGEPGYQLRKKNATVYRNDWLSQLIKKSRLAFLVRALLKRRSDFEDYIKWYKENILHGQTTVRAALSLFSQLHQQWHFDACVIIIPEFTTQFSEYKSNNFHSKVLEESKGLPGFTLIDLLGDFSKLSNDASIFAYDGLHLNKHGHEVLANILLPVVTGDTGRSTDRQNCRQGHLSDDIPTARTGSAQIR